MSVFPQKAFVRISAVLRGVYSRELTLGRVLHPWQVRLFPECSGQGKSRGEALQLSPVAATGCVVWVLSGTGVDARDSLWVRSVSSSLAGSGPFYLLFSSQVPSLTLNILKSFAPKGHPYWHPLCNSDSNEFMSLITIFLYIDDPNREGQQTL